MSFPTPVECPRCNGAELRASWSVDRDRLTFVCLECCLAWDERPRQPVTLQRVLATVHPDPKPSADEPRRSVGYSPLGD